MNQIVFGMGTVLALVLKLNYLNKEFWHDEAFQILFAKMPMSIILGSNDVHPPLFTLIIKFMLFFTENHFVLRLVILILSIMFSLYFYFTIKEWFGENVATMSYLFLCLSTTFAYYSVEIRAYMFVLLLTIIQIRHFHRMVQGKKGSETIYVLTSALMIYSHYTAGLIIAVQFFFLILTKKPRSIYANYIHLLALSVPLLIYFFKTLPKIQSFWFEPVTLKSFISTYFYFIAKPSTPDFYLIVLFMLTFICMTVVVLWKEKFVGEHIYLAWCYLFFPVAGMWFLNQVGIQMYHHRYFLFGGMFIFLFAGYSLGKIHQNTKVIGTINVVFILLVASNLILFSTPQVSSPVYDSAMMIDEPGRANIVHTSQWSQSPYKWLLPEHNHYLVTDVNRSARFTAGGSVIMDWEVLPKVNGTFKMPKKPYYFVTDQNTIGGEIIYDKEGLMVKKYE